MQSSAPAGCGPIKPRALDNLIGVCLEDFLFSKLNMSCGCFESCSFGVPVSAEISDCFVMDFSLDLCWYFR